jgi:hypothetical protein
MFQVTKKWWWHLTIKGTPLKLKWFWKGPYGLFRWCLHKQDWIFFLKKHLVCGHAVPWLCFNKKHWGELHWVSGWSLLGFWKKGKMDDVGEKL